MCYHVKSPSADQLITFSMKEKLQLDFDQSNYLPHYHVSGFSHPMLAVVAGGRVSLMRWGLIPGWARDPEKAREIQNRTLNAIGEEIFEKASYKAAVVKNRGALLVDGFYEWREFQKKKYPYFIHASSLLTLGCVFTTAANPDTGEVVQTFSIVTTAATPLMAAIHNTKKRMPLVLADWRRWVSPELDRPGIESFMRPSALDLQAHTISNRLNHFQKGGTDTADITDVVHYPELPDL